METAPPPLAAREWRGRGLIAASSSAKIAFQNADESSSVFRDASLLGSYLRCPRRRDSAVVAESAAGAKGALPPCRVTALAIQQGCLRRGLIVELGGRRGATVRLLPPLVISADEVDTVAEILRLATLDAAARRPTAATFSA